MFRLPLTCTLLFACTFEEFSGGTAPSTSYVITEGDIIQVDIDKSDLMTSSTVYNQILDLPEIGLAVFEVDYVTIENNRQHVDELLRIEHRASIEPNSDLMQKLRAERMQNIHTLGSIPINLYEEAQRYHQLNMNIEEEAKIFTSDIMKNIIDSVDDGASIIYLPVQEESIPSITFEALQYAQDYGVQCFDVDGKTI